METPSSIAEHQADYRDGAWEEYTCEELVQWVSLLVKRATHRGNPDKRAKDLRDARNYLDMLEALL